MYHGGRWVAKALKEEGVSCVFTLCGGHVQSIYDGCLDEEIRVVDVRHEQTAGHAAEGWARATGRPGVAIVTAGPGTTDCVTAVANAQRAGVPMVVIGGQGPFTLRGMGSLQEMDHVSLMKPITKWADTCYETRRLPEYIQTAFRMATSGVPGPVFLEIPLDVLMGMTTESDAVRHEGYRTRARPAPDPTVIDEVAPVLAEAERPVLVLGSQIRWSNEGARVVREFLDACPMPCYLNGLARGYLPPDHPCFFNQSRSRTLRQADLVFILGTPLDFRLKYGREDAFPDETILIQVDLDAGEIGRNRRVDHGIVGDSGLVFEALVDRLSDTEVASRDGWLNKVREAEESKRQKIQDELTSDAVPVNPLRYCHEVSKIVDENTVIIGDGGDILGAAAKIVSAHKPGHWMDPGPLGTLGVGPGYAMAAQLARPDSRVIIIYGDGSFGLHGLEFEAMVRQNLPVVGIIGNDACWMQIHRGQKAIYGNKRTVATELDYTRYDKVVEAVGGHGEYVEDPADLADALQRALDSGKPALVNVKIGESDFRKNAISV